MQGSERPQFDRSLVLLRFLGASLLGQFDGGRYAARWFYLIATGLVVMSLPLILLGVAETWIPIAVGVALMWVDWRHEQYLNLLDRTFLSSPSLEPGEQLRLRAYKPIRRLVSLEIWATNRRLCWGRLGLTGGASTIGRTGRTEIDLTEIARVERRGSWLRVWTEHDALSIEFAPQVVEGGPVADQWFAYLQEGCQTAQFTVSETEVVRNSPMLKPLLLGVAALVMLIPWVVYLTIELRG